MSSPLTPSLLQDFILPTIISSVKGRKTTYRKYTEKEKYKINVYTEVFGKFTPTLSQTYD